MRNFVIFVVLAGLAYGGFLYFRVVEAVPEQTDEPNALVEDDEPVVPPKRGEVEELLDQIDSDPSDASDRQRLRLAQIYLDKKDTQPRRDAEVLLKKVVHHDGENAFKAAVLLMRQGSDKVREVYATFVLEGGEGSPAYREAALVKGRQLARSNETGKQVKAWRLLSKAYVARDDEKWRSSFRSELQKLTHRLMYTPTIHEACLEVVVKPGDSLERIARENKTTVDALRWLNQLSGDLIHPGQRLKLLRGEITIEIDKGDYRLDAFIDGNYLFGAKVGLGKFDKTPIGSFEIDLKQEDPTWHPSGRPPIAAGNADNPLGKRWLGFRNTAEHQGYGIHGTDEPDSIGTQSSEGCIRLRNEDVIRLYRLVPRGTRVFIRE